MVARERRTVAVFGSSIAEPGSDIYRLATEVGQELGRRGFDVVSGGYAGVMEAVSAGARTAGAERVVGVTCSVFVDRKGPNEHVSEVRHTETISERTAVLIDSADAYIVLDGGIGTLAEMMLVWLQLLVSRDRPVVVVGHRWIGLVEFLRTRDLVTEPQVALLGFADGAASAVQQVANLTR